MIPLSIGHALLSEIKIYRVNILALYFNEAVQIVLIKA